MVVTLLEQQMTQSNLFHLKDFKIHRTAEGRIYLDRVCGVNCKCFYPLKEKVHHWYLSQIPFCRINLCEVGFPNYFLKTFVFRPFLNPDVGFKIILIHSGFQTYKNLKRGCQIKQFLYDKCRIQSRSIFFKQQRNWKWNKLNNRIFN